MIITTLVDNSSYNEELLKEHGLSVYIEHNGTNILFDTGLTNKFSMNAAKLDINLRDVDIAIISHGHYDHLGGLIDFLSLNDKAKVYLKREIFDTQYVSIKDGNILDRGYPDELIDYKDRFVFLDNDVTRDGDIVLINNIDNTYPLPKGNKLLYTTIDGEMERDDFDHELLFAIEHDDELIMFSGCAHNGVINMIGTLKKYFPDKNIKMIHGGFHLIESQFTVTETEDEIKEIATLMTKYAPKAMIYTGHCTSKNSLEQLKSYLGSCIEPFYTGHRIEI